MSNITAEILTRERRLTPYRDLWERLYACGSGEPSTSFEWADALTRSHLEPDDQFVLLGVRRDDDIVGLMPLVASRLWILGCPVTALSPLAERYNTHSELLTGTVNQDVIRAVVSALADLDLRWDVFRMARVLAGHPAIALAGQRPGEGRLMGHVRNGPPSYFLALPSTFDEYLGQRSGKFRNHLKRTEKRLAQRGDVQILEVSDVASIERAYERLLAIERASWKHAHGTAISAVARQTRFYRDLCEGAAEARRLHLQILMLGDRAAAYNLGYLAHGCYAYLKTSYDHELRPLGVATFLRARLIQGLIERGVTAFDFPAEPYEWERQWTDTVREHKVLTFHAPTTVGRVLARAERFRHRTAASPQIEHVDPRALRPRGVEMIP